MSNKLKLYYYFRESLFIFQQNMGQYVITQRFRNP